MFVCMDSHRASSGELPTSLVHHHCPPHCIASTGVTGLLFLFLPTIPNPTLWLPPLFL